MQDKLQGLESAHSPTERRACPRFRVTSLVYIDIGKVNGEIVTSLSECGLALTAVTALGEGELGDGPLRLRIQFPGIPEAFEASGQVVWTSSSGKEAGVRFVELEEKAREQIRNWISAQAGTNGARLDPAKLPKLRLPNSPAPKARRYRFSFSDVASSPVDAEAETTVEDFPEIARETGALPPLQASGAAFGNATEAVAPTFENPAFTEDLTGKTSSLANDPATQTTSDQNPPRQPSLTVPERRQRSRRQILLFTYAALGEDNGGLVFNLSESGFAITAATALQEHHFKNIRLRFPDSEDWIESSGRLAWKNKSGKEVGIEFVDLPEDARLRIREWVSQEEPTGDLRSEEGEARTSQSPVQKLPSFMEPDGSSVEPLETPAAFEEQSFEDRAFEEHRFENEARTPAAFSSALFKTGIKGVFERASVRRRVTKIKPPRLPVHSERPRTRMARKAIGMAAGVALAISGWMFFQRSPSNEATGVIAQTVPNAPSSREATHKLDAAKTEAGQAQPTTEPSVYSNKTDATQTSISKPSIQQFRSSAPSASTSKTAASPSASPGRASKEKSLIEQTVADVPPTDSPHRSGQPQRALPARREQQTKATLLTASASTPAPENKLAENKPVETKSAETKPAESKPVQVTQAPPTLSLNKDANTAPPTLNSNPTQPAAVQPADLEKEKPLVAPKQPEAPLVRTPVVTVSFDPYPSIRMPKAEGSKKAHQGKSLQMGRLLARVDPVYPEEAKQQGVEGTVRVHVIFNHEGAVQSVISESGPSLLVAAAVNAVRQVRYSQTILGGQAMETEEDVTVLFRLTNSTSKN